MNTLIQIVGPTPIGGAKFPAQNKTKQPQPSTQQNAYDRKCNLCRKFHLGLQQKHNNRSQQG